MTPGRTFLRTKPHLEADSGVFAVVSPHKAANEARSGRCRRRFYAQSHDSQNRGKDDPHG
jgi:hypothetical protein